MKSKSRNNAVSYFDMQFITSSISTTLVLLLLGLVVFFVLAANNLSVYVRENINFSVLISDDMKETDILKLQKRLNNEPFVKETEYISKKQALKEQTEAMGTDPQEFLGLPALPRQPQPAPAGCTQVPCRRAARVVGGRKGVRHP